MYYFLVFTGMMAVARLVGDLKWAWFFILLPGWIGVVLNMVVVIIQTNSASRMVRGEF